VGIVSPGVCALVVGISINEVDNESTKSIAIAIAPVLFFENTFSMFDIFLLPFL
jgi:hypothetical protein